MRMDISIQDILFVISTILNLIGIVGSVVPMLPGPPLNFIAMLLCCIACPTPLMIVLTVFTGLFVIFITIADYMAPAWLAKWAGGCKQASIGATVGLFIGMFYVPWGLVIGPFLGAFICEFANTFSFGSSLKVGMYSMLSLIAGTVFKLISCIAILIVCVCCMLYYYLAA